MISELLNQPCTILSRTASTDEDEYGNTTTATTSLETVCWLQQDRRDEPGNQGELGVASWTIFLPAGTPIDTGDAVQVDGHVYELVGPPWEAAPPTTNVPHHVEATAVRVAGSEETGS